MEKEKVRWEESEVFVFSFLKKKALKPLHPSLPVPSWLESDVAALCLSPLLSTHSCELLNRAWRGSQPDVDSRALFMERHSYQTEPP